MKAYLVQSADANEHFNGVPRFGWIVAIAFYTAIGDRYRIHDEHALA